jgi:hypothetical protein
VRFFFMSNRVRRIPAALAALLLALGGVSCTKCVVRGKVVDFAEEELPGVAITIVGRDAQDLSNSRGDYKVACFPGHLELLFMKTGYTVGHLEVDVNEPRGVDATTVKLWRLPPEAGVFLLEGFRYVKAFAVDPKPFSSSEGKLAFVIPRLPEIPETTAADPALMMHKVPFFDMSLCRLAPVEASPLEATNVKQEVWAPGRVYAVAVRPVDEPERTLWEVAITEPLEPGVYAVHWGAFEGHTSTDPRTFLFRVAAPETPEPEPAPEAGEAPTEEKTSES